MGNKSSPELTLLFLLTTSLCLEALTIKNIIHLPSVKMNWENARLYCQKNYIDLVTSDKADRSTMMELLMDAGVKEVWVGEPVDADCATFNSDKEKLHSAACSKELPPACYGDNLVVVNMDMTWEDAVSYCLSIKTPCVGALQPCTLKYNLVSMEKILDSFSVRTRIITTVADEFWIGLRFLGGQWWWLSGQKLRDEKMLPNCLTEQKHCGTLSKHTSNWTNRDCTEKRNFICYGEIVTNDDKI